MTNNKDLFMKWIQILFYVQCVALAARFISELPFVGTWFGWVTRLITIATIIILFKLIPLNVRYRKAVIFMAVSAVTVFLVSEVVLLAVPGAICSIIATYQEYIGHSEVMAEVDEKLSRNWRSLFNWEIWGGLGVSFIVEIAVMIISIATSTETDLTVTVCYAALDIYNMVLQMVYLVLLKRMLAVYANYEPQEEIEILEEA